MELSFFRMGDVMDSRIDLNRVVEYCPDDSNNVHSIYLSIENVDRVVKYVYESEKKRDEVLKLLDLACLSKIPMPECISQDMKESEIT